TNILAIQALNNDAADPNFLIKPQLTARILRGFDTNAPRYFPVPTPGAQNNNGSTVLGPVISEVANTPEPPGDSNDITVTARITPTFRGVAQVTLNWRVMFGGIISTQMFDDGLHGDGLAGDGLFGAVIPASASAPGQMVRWYITARDTNNVSMREPPFFDPQGSPEYYGTVVADPSVVTLLPVFHWFIQSLSGADTEAGGRGSIYFNGQFRDNVLASLHGQSSSGFPKKSYNFDMNRGGKIVWRPDAPPLSDFAILSTYADRAHFRNVLNAQQYAWSGVPCHISFAVRMQMNGAFFSVANFIDGGDEELLERLGFDPDGALYKMYNNATNISGNEKKTRKYEGFDDLQALITACMQSDVNARVTYAYDNFNLPEMVNFLAGKSVPNDHDCCHKNYYLYRDSNRTGEWHAFPWDMDLTWGHIWMSAPNGQYFNDLIQTDQYGAFYGSGSTPFGVIWNDPALQSMWKRRVRSLMDQILQPPGTPASNDILRAQMDYYENLVRSDAALDFAKWPAATWTPPVSPPRDLTNETARMKDLYLPGRRAFLFVNRVNAGDIPQAQPTNTPVGFGAIEYNPASGNQA
ncbi:MAG: CotH kinase family protein, partial [Verrucomicrobia bacterium]|nr:CotH kinase family protein [Verrucomicrobiota bacterium]